jgi:hypothetical protein
MENYESKYFKYKNKYLELKNNNNNNNNNNGARACFKAYIFSIIKNVSD